MPGCRRFLVAGALTLAVIGGTTGTGIADEADRGKTSSFTKVFSFTDGRITESSGLVDAGALMFTVNDSGDGPVVYVVDKTSGDTVGVTTYSSDDVSDVEAIAPGPDGTVWVGDIGDNDMDRTSVDLYAVPRPGRGNAEVGATRFRLIYPDAAQDAEALLVHPRTGRVYVVSKAILGGVVYAAPPSLEPGSVNRLSAIGHVPGLVTDGAFFPDGNHVLLRSYGSARVYTFPGLREVGEVDMPAQEQGEAVAIGRSGRIYVSTEGEFSDVTRVELPVGLRASIDSGQDARADTDTGNATTNEPPSRNSVVSSTGIEDGVWLVGGSVALVATGLAMLTVSRRRSRRRP